MQNEKFLKEAAFKQALYEAKRRQHRLEYPNVTKEQLMEKGLNVR